MSTLNDGGPAYPFQFNWPSTGPEASYGMTLRDWFAGQALAGIMANSKLPGVISSDVVTWAADKAYDAADAMLRRKQP